MTRRAQVPPDSRLAFVDQALFLGQRATGQEAVAQIVWVYEHAVDVGGLRRFHHYLGHGLLGRRIERSPLPFGRHRWVSSVGPPSDMDFVEGARPRAELSDWVDERSQLPVDPEWGPGWHLGVLPMTDGSTAVSLVGSHCLTDGFGLFLTVIDAVKGNVRDLGYPPPRSRTRLRAVASDARQTVQGLPEVAGALVGGARVAFRRRHEFGRSGAPSPTTILAGGDDNVVVPAISIYLDLNDWDARAKALGGSSHSLLAGLAARLGERLGRRRLADGAVTLNIPISDRAQDDTRANAVSLTDVCVDSTQVTTDLSGARVAIRQALKTLREVPDETLQLLPLTPFIPKRAVRRGADVLFGFADLPVSCSNLGEVDPTLGRPDGTDAEYVMLRGVDRCVTRQFLERRRGLLTVLGGRVGGKVSVTVVAYQPGAENSKPHLRELAAQTLAEFDLAGLIE
ncbi:MAG: hypothetical protein JWR37_5852 [Mycobacterium sp.]|nr:hypothetical protein [Mycobacterium sp.]